jgi:carboxypeptidase C (cathepsin A)
MEKTFLLVFLIAVFSFTGSRAQNKADEKPKTGISHLEKSEGLRLPPDTVVVTDHEAAINGQHFTYTATAGTQPVWDKDGKVIASLFYVYYQRNDVKNREDRPLLISFNGGPGTGSVWQDIGFTGPMRLKVSDEGYPVQPYGVTANPYSILDIADVVYVNPVNCGFSRILDPKVDHSTFFGVNADIKYLSDWISTFVSREGRWRSPKFLLGESYGTTRVSGMADALQNAEWMYLDGVILVSPTDLGIKRDGPVSEALNLPYYAATAWYHKALSPDLQQQDLADILPQVEKYTINDYIPALARGGSLSVQDKEKAAEMISKYSGLPEKHILQHNLIIPPSFFWKDLLRDSGYTIGRLDSRYLGEDEEKAGTHPDYNAELTSWLDAFTPAINYYLRDVLNFKTDLKYNMFGPVFPWDDRDNYTGEQLRSAMLSNPVLHLLVMSGYYDGACEYFNAKYSMWQIDSNGKLKNRMEWKGYRSGHMMYLRKDDLKKASEDLRNFIESSIPPKGQAIRY